MVEDSSGDERDLYQDVLTTLFNRLRDQKKSFIGNVVLIKTNLKYVFADYFFLSIKQQLQQQQSQKFDNTSTTVSISQQLLPTPKSTQPPTNKFSTMSQQQQQQPQLASHSSTSASASAPLLPPQPNNPTTIRVQPP